MQPFCHCCGKPIPKYTELHFVRNPRGGSPKDSIEGPIYSKAEAQAKVNTIQNALRTVVSVRYSQDYDMNADSNVGPRYVSSFYTWDGESYRDEFFCSGPCVDRFAYIMARAGWCTNLYNDAGRKQRDGGRQAA
jgi:hypothetical protein